MKVDEVAEVLRICKMTAWRLLRKGQIPGTVRVGRAWRVYRPTLEMWIGG